MRTRILAIRLQATGDVVITLPYLNSLKRRFPEAELDLLARLIGKIRATEGDLVSAPEPRAGARP